MATMVKEKRKEKKKTKAKYLPELESKDKEILESPLIDHSKEFSQDFSTNLSQASTSNTTEDQPISRNVIQENLVTSTTINIDNFREQEISSTSLEVDLELDMVSSAMRHEVQNKELENKITKDNEITNILAEARRNLEEITLDSCTVSIAVTDINDDITEIDHDDALDSNTLPNLLCPEGVVLAEDVVIPSAPSAPIEVEAQPYMVAAPRENVPERVGIPCMPLEEAVRVFGGKEIAEVKAMSEREEAIVEAGPQSGPEHPLVDLLSTFRTSLISIERERNRISAGYVDEEKSRAALWQVEKRNISVSQQCPCGAEVNVRASYEVARLQTEKMPAARLRLEALLRDVQECYCHHQHAALRAHCDIDELVAEIIQSSKSSVREALLLVLQALQLSDAAPDAFAQALQRWACVLSASLLDQRDWGHLLFLLHCLFRQNRSVQWAARVVALQVPDAASAARLAAVLELLLTRPLLEEAVECTEESESWEEVDPRGEGGAVGEGRLRERDLLALLEALPLRDMIARMLLFTRADISKEDDQSWGDKSGGRGVLKASCGVRVLLSVLQRALAAHAGYTRLRAALRRLAAAALSALAALHLHSRHGYVRELEQRIAAELEACFVAGVEVLREEAHAAPASLLRHHVARDYCDTLIHGLHDAAPLRVGSLSLAVGVAACALRVRIVAHAALDRELDHELAATVLGFLLHVGIKGARAACKGSCDVTARQLLPLLLAQHRLHTNAFHILADFYQVEAIDPSLLQPLAPQQWRPTPGEARALLDDWAARCSPLVQHLLLQLDYTPHTGVSLESQLLIGAWLCAWLRPQGDAPEWAWQVLRALRVHRTQWGVALEAPPAEEAQDLLSDAFALMASDWGHCIPLICGAGVEALLRVARARPADAVRCAGPLMRVMAQSPESVALTPKFAEVFTAIVNSGPSLVQRALGRRACSGRDLLQRLLLDHVQDTRVSKPERGALLSAWLHALWRPSVPGSARGVLDAAVRACCDWRTLDAHAALLLQEENYKEYLSDAVRNVCEAPLLCESLLRAAHAHEVHAQLHARLVTELARQHAAAQRIHVDNALKLLGSSLTADELAVHRCACAALAAPLQHPAHLLLWRLLLHMFLQRPPAAPPDSPPVGPLYFSGLVKSRTLAQLKKRLQETAAYHRTQAETLKTTEANTASPNTSTSSKEQNSDPTSDSSLFSTLALFDLTGATESDESSSERDGDSDDEGARETSVDRDTFNLVCYHTAAEKIVREYLVWLEEGTKVRAMPHHADIARFLSEQALAAAWRASVSGATSPEDSPPAPPRTDASEPHAARAHTTHTERAVRAVTGVASRRRRRYRVPALPVVKDEAYFRDAQLVVGTVQKLLTELEKLAREWVSDVQRARACDAQLWELVGRLRARRPLPPVRKACPHACKPVTVHIAKDEWCISSGAQQGIQDNRRSARAAIRQLSRPRPHDARTTSRVQSIARRIRSQACALRVAELAASAAPRTQGYPPAHDAVCALVADIAARFISVDASLATAYLERWSCGGDAQRQLCLMLVDPPRLSAREWPALYAAVLRLSLPPHVTFSYISKFELSVWADAADAAQRGELLEALLQAARRMTPEPDDQHLMLLELLGVHSSCAARAPELCAHVLRCARACAACALPPPYLSHLPELVDRYGDGLDFDQLGNLLRELGVLLWSARSTASVRRALFASYAPHFAATLRALLRQFVAAAVRRTYQPERVAAYAWSALQESWSAWVAPHCSAPLLPSTADAEAYTDMLTRFRDTVTMVMEECPGSEDVLLRHVYQWVVQSYLGMAPQWPQEARVQMSALLAHLRALPWTRQWFSVDVLQLTLQMSRSTERELTSWCGACLQHQHGDAWLQGAAQDQLAPTLADLLEIFTSSQLSLPSQTLEQACRLPWWRLPEPALSHALQRYFADHHSPAAPYHDAPHFRTLLSACQLLPPSDACESPPLHAHAHAQAAACEKRAHAVSQWVRAASVPALSAHVPAHAQRLLDTLTALAQHISAEELTRLLSRAVVVMCVEPAAARALPVWQRWVGACPPAARRAAASAAATLTTLDYFAALGDAVARAVLAERESEGWSALVARWAECAWWEGGALVSRGALHAAYAMLHARAHSHAHLRHALGALLAGDVNFVHDEAVVALWVCVAGRAAGSAGCGEESAGCAEAARALLSRWAEQRRTLLQMVTLSAADTCPTAQHRLLCRLALCIVSPSEANVKAYEAACSPLLGNTDAMAWGRSPRVDLLPRLAARLYPHHEVYFKEELELTANLVHSVTTTASI